MPGVRTYIASGNVVFDSGRGEAEVKAGLEAALHAYAGKPVGVMVRTGAEMAEVLAANPFADRPSSEVVAIFLDEPPPADLMAGVRGQAQEAIAAGKREIYVHYGEGMGRSKLKIPAAAKGTARNINTVAKLAEWAGG